MIDPRLMDMIMRLRSRGVYDSSVLSAMESVPRRYFVSDALYEAAYDERALPIDCGQTLSSPLTIALMTQVLELKRDHKLLEVGTGSGYHTAILSRLSTRVYSIERYHQLIKAAEARFSQCELMNIVVRHGDGLKGWKGQAPFDRIIVTCGLERKPTALLNQLADGGRLLAVVKGMLTQYDKSDQITSRDVIALELPLAESGKSKVL